MNDVCLLYDDLVMTVLDIASYITGKQKDMDVHGKISGEAPYEKSFLKAHALFLNLEQKLQKYPKIIKHPIAQSTLRRVREVLHALKQLIESLPDSQDKNQFRNELDHLNQSVCALMIKK